MMSSSVAPRRPSSPRLRALSSSSSISDEREAVAVRRANSAAKLAVVTPDRCKGCLRLFSKMLTTKQCFRCKNYVCALCVFKVPMFHGEKGKLPKHSLHARLCASCYDESILRDNSTNSASSQPEMSPPSGRDTNGSLFDDDACDCAPASTIVVAGPSGTASLWLSLVTGSLMLGAVLLESTDFHVRAGSLVGLYVVFVVIHPLWKSPSTPLSAQLPPRRKPKATRDPSETASSDDEDEPSINMDAVLLAKKEWLEARWSELTSEQAAWVKNESKSTASVTLSELDCGDDMPVCIKVEAFVPNTSADEILSFIGNPDPKERIKWDSHMAAHTVVESVEWPATAQSGRVVHNVQKSHGMGLVPSRDFVLLALRKSPTIYVQGSLEHPSVPDRPGSVRGLLHILGFECVQTDDGVHLTYINHVDIKGSLPRKLVANGTCDNMVRLMTTAIHAKKKWLV
ncbi:hypothetical protein SPRG_00466 [Saprolegnia parasitica CBS 223.65]|uniref:START domain-containing protein n=1 Tax=Saprolegnia parasitica (strain CBS 223.65) TaxID=695850 RepID=A0A067D9E7_SAPPC|nr:hypothetical protein SPRG_00466 [Saprolegnia parasitica CBS 223.65]KDO35622.1 hypothetical protein SPRG_00466 [Saprolegnia parasitica CBS 223.65]|eukprot:XP_012193950.1 hypothetical protein SPRG_00466 [Saprolegnia parasitica CBS 223.65]